MLEPLAPPDLPLASAFSKWGDHRHLQELIDDAERVCFLTGAGLSAASGLHTYRGKDGRWKTEEPVTYQSFLHDRSRRMVQWQRTIADFDAFSAAMPNKGHEAIARLVRAGHVLVTQNIDGLHERAGSEVLELHGNGTRAVCIRCGRRHAIDEGVRAAVASGKPPHCVECDYILRPDVVLFGADLDKGVWNRATKAATECDLFIAVGTSLEVRPAADLPRMAMRRGAGLVIMVDGVTQLHGNADLLIAGDASAVLAQVQASC